MNKKEIRKRMFYFVLFIVFVFANIIIPNLFVCVIIAIGTAFISLMFYEILFGQDEFDDMDK